MLRTENDDDDDDDDGDIVHDDADNGITRMKTKQQQKQGQMTTVKRKLKRFLAQYVT